MNLARKAVMNEIIRLPSEITDDYVFLVSIENPEKDTTAGRVVEVTRDNAAYAIANKTHEFATDEQIKAYREEMAARAAAIQAEARKKMQPFVVQVRGSDLKAAACARTPVPDPPAPKVRAASTPEATPPTRAADRKTERRVSPPGWERQPGESARAWRAFVTYRDQGPGRSLDRVGLIVYPGQQKGGKRGASRKRGSVGYIERWAQRWDWSTRVAEYDTYLDSRRQQTYVEEIEMLARLQAGEAVRATAVLMAPVLEFARRLQEDPNALRDLELGDLLRAVHSGFMHTPSSGGWLIWSASHRNPAH